MARDVYAEVTTRILSELEKGAAPWVKPWTGTANALPYNASTKAFYKGSNVILLWIAAQIGGYASSGWLTYKQAEALGGNVKKGEKSSLVTYFSPVKKMEANGEEKKFFIAKSYPVFNIDQCENLPETIVPSEVSEDRIPEAELFIANTGATVRVGGTVACYVPSQDVIMMPPFKSFVNVDNYYSTKFHELAHWTGAKGRLNRELKSRIESNSSYALEELTAELTAAFLCAEMGFSSDLRHTGYIQSWIKLLKADNRAFMKAASAAQKAADYLRNKQNEVEEDVALAMAA